MSPLLLIGVKPGGLAPRGNKAFSMRRRGRLVVIRSKRAANWPPLQKRLIPLQTLDILYHFAAGGGAVAAGLGALRHVFVIGEFLTGGVAFVTRFCTGIAKDGRQDALPSSQLGRRATDFTTINAQLHGLGVILVPIHHKPSAVVIAGIAFLKAFGAGLGALVEVFRMFGVGLVSRCPASSKSRQTGCPGAQNSQDFSTVHNRVS